MVLVEWWDDCDMVGIESCSTKKNLERLVESRTTGRVLELYHGLGGSSCEGLVRPKSLCSFLQTPLQSTQR